MASISNNVLLYNGQGADATCVKCTLKALNQYNPEYSLIACDGSYMEREGSPIAYVFPGGDAMEMATGIKSAAMKVRKYVIDGSGFIGICAGALVASMNPRVIQPQVSYPFHTDYPLEKSLEIGSFAVTPAFSELAKKGNVYTTPLTKLVTISHGQNEFKAYWARGPILCTRMLDTPIALYKDPVNPQYKSLCGSYQEPVALMYTSAGSGNVALLGFHPELAEYCEAEGFQLTDHDRASNTAVFQDTCAYVGLELPKKA